MTQQELSTKRTNINNPAIEFTELPEFCNEGLDLYKRNFLPQSKMRSVGTVFDFADISAVKNSKISNSSRRNCNSLSPNTKKIGNNTYEVKATETINLPTIPQTYVQRLGNGFNQTKPTTISTPKEVEQSSIIPQNISFSFDNPVSTYISCSKLRHLNSRKRRRQSKRSSVCKGNLVLISPGSKIFDSSKLNDFMALPLKIEASISFQSKVKLI